MKEKKSAKMIENAIGKNGEVLCPSCGKGSTWIGEDGNRWTSPMRRFVIAGKVNALMHVSCIDRMLREAKIHAK
jgi:hypothetical protein